MRIGIYISGMSEKSGAYTFEQGILESLLKLKNRKDLYVFSNFDDEVPKDTRIKFLKLEKPIIQPRLKRFTRKLLGKIIQIPNQDEKSYISPLDKAVKQNNIEVLWYATQYYEPADIPYIFTVWDLEHRVHPFFPEVSVNKNWSLREDLYRRVIPAAAFIITGTKVGKQEVIKFYQVLEERIKVIPFPAPDYRAIYPTKNYDLESDFNVKSPYLFYPSTYHPHKNHFRVLETLIILEKKYHLPVSAVFAGADCGNKAYLEKKSREFNLHRRVKFLDFIPLDQLVYLYKNALALIYPSYFGPDNLPPLEAFLLKCPVIASKINGALDQLGNRAILADPDNANAFASAVAKIIADKKFCCSLVSRAFKFAEKWTFDDYVKSVLLLIDGFSPVRSCWGTDLRRN